MQNLFHSSFLILLFYFIISGSCRIRNHLRDRDLRNRFRSRRIRNHIHRRELIMLRFLQLSVREHRSLHR